MKVLRCATCKDTLAKTDMGEITGRSISSDIIDFPQGHVVGDDLLCKKCGQRFPLEHISSWEDE